MGIHHPQELERFLKVEVDRVKIPGFIKIFNTTKIERSGNALLRISVCAEAKERLKQLDYQLRIGASGFTKFEDVRAGKKVINCSSRQERIAELRKSIAEEKERFAARCKELRDLEKAETESVGSMGVSNLDIAGEKGSEPMEEDKEKFLATSGDEAPEAAGKE